MRINAKDPALISFIGDFLRVYLPSVRNRDPDTIDSYKNTINLYLLYLQKAFGITLMTVQSGDFNQKNIVSFMSWLKNERGNVAPTINHHLAKKKAITALSYEEIREIKEAIDRKRAQAQNFKTIVKNIIRKKRVMHFCFIHSETKGVIKCHGIISPEF